MTLEEIIERLGTENWNLSTPEHLAYMVHALALRQAAAERLLDDIVEYLYRKAEEGLPEGMGINLGFHKLPEEIFGEPNQ